MISYRICRILYLLFIIVYNVQAKNNYSHSNSDTTISPNKLNLKLFLATSFLLNANWKNTHYSFITFTGSFDITYNKCKENYKRIQEFRGELSYSKYIDSSWVKNTDDVFLSSIWTINDGNTLRNSFSLSIKTQMTDTWDNYYHSNQLKRKWVSGPFLPVAFIAGYGINFLFQKNSYLNISFASMKINSRQSSGKILPDTKIIAKTDKIIFISEYGMNIQSAIEKLIVKNVTWENKTSFFTSSLDKKTMNLDMQNIISIFPFRFIKIRLEYRMVYDYFISDKFQFRYELLLGYTFRNN